jgi:hypothetical protein
MGGRFLIFPGKTNGGLVELLRDKTLSASVRPKAETEG